LRATRRSRTRAAPRAELGGRRACLGPKGVHEHVLKRRYERIAIADRRLCRHLVPEAVVSQPLEKRAEEVAAAVEVMVVFDEQLLDTRDRSRGDQILEHVVLRPLHVELDEVDVAWDDTRETQLFDRGLAAADSLSTGAHSKRRGIVGIFEERDHAVLAAQSRTADLDAGQGVRLDVPAEQLMHARRRLEGEHVRSRIERLEEEDGHPDVAAAVDDDRIGARGAEVVLKLDEDLPVEVRQRRDREARDVEAVDLHVHETIGAAANSACCEPQLGLHRLARPTARNGRVRKRSASRARLLDQTDRVHEPTDPAIAATTRSAARPSTSPTTARTTRRRSSASSPGSARQRSIPATTSSNRSARRKAPESTSSR